MLLIKLFFILFFLFPVMAFLLAAILFFRLRAKFLNWRMPDRYGKPNPYAPDNNVIEGEYTVIDNTSGDREM